MFFRIINIEKYILKPIIIIGLIMVFLFINACDFCTSPTNNGGVFENILIFTSKSANDNKDVIFTSSAIGTALKAINTKSGAIYSAPSLNDKITYTKFDGLNGINVLYISDLNGENENLLLKESGLFQIINPIISADGTKICFYGGFNRLLVYDLKKFSVNQITSKLATNSLGTFSPDGKKLAYLENDNIDRIKIKVIDTENIDVISTVYDNIYDGIAKKVENNNVVSWSNDNNYISFSYSFNGRDYIKIINIETKQEISFDFANSNISIENPIVNFKKNIVVFKGIDGNIWARNLESNDNRLFQLTEANLNESYSIGSWSPDDKYFLAINSYNDLSNNEYNDLMVIEVEKNNSIPTTENLYLISNDAKMGFWKAK